MKKTYKDALIGGYAFPEMLEDLVDEWHETPSITEPLHVFLGFDSLDEYDRALRPEVYENTNGAKGEEPIAP